MSKLNFTEFLLIILLMLASALGGAYLDRHFNKSKVFGDEIKLTIPNTPQKIRMLLLRNKAEGAMLDQLQKWLDETRTLPAPTKPRELDKKRG